MKVPTAIPAGLHLGVCRSPSSDGIRWRWIRGPAVFRQLTAFDAPEAVRCVFSRHLTAFAPERPEHAPRHQRPDSRVTQDGAMADDVDWRALLDDRLARAEAQRASLLSAIEEIRTSRSLTFTDDEHDPEGSTVSLDQVRDTALLERVQTTIADLAAARERLDAGTFGSCHRCGRQIPTERLLVRPASPSCVACAAGRRR